MPLLRYNFEYGSNRNTCFIVKSDFDSDSSPNFFKRKFIFKVFNWRNSRCIGRMYSYLSTLENFQGFNDIKGIMIAFLGTLLTSVGDASSARNANRKVDPIYENAIGFTVGSLLMGAIVLFQGQEFIIPRSVSYLSALLYLTLVASFAAWLFYLKIVEKIGGAQSGYMVALFPAIGGVASVFIGESDPSWYLFAGSLFSCIGAAIALGFGKRNQNVKLPVRIK